jgi:hypothetical protein
MRTAGTLALALLVLAVSAGPLAAAETTSAKTAVATTVATTTGPAKAAATKPAAASSAPKTYTLRYHFQPGETLRWKVTQRTEVAISVSGSKQTASTAVESVKAWQILNVREDGTVTFQHSFESIDLRHKYGGSEEAHYNSRTDKTPPRGFEDAARQVGVPLAVVTMNSRGEIQSRQRNPKLKPSGTESDGAISVPLPERAVAVGETWSLPCDTTVPLSGGIVKKIKTVQKFKLAGVEHGVATIEMNTLVLTPIHDPAIEVQLIQRDSSSTIRFDIDAGRILGQQVDVDKRVVGFRGEASSLHYLARVNEEAIGESERAATTASTAGSTPDAATPAAAAYLADPSAVTAKDREPERK